jgi:subtilisin family serine protease
MDHSFGLDSLPDLYAGGATFQEREWAASYRTRAHHGSWMARALKEIAPDVDVYALGTYDADEDRRVDAMVRALDWAVANRLDVVTYSARAFSAGSRARLDPAVQRAVAAGVVVVFLHYPHGDNLLPSAIGPRSGDDEREPDVNIFHYDYGVLFVEPYAALMRGDDARGYRPFLSLSSTAPVTAGLVALLKSVDPSLTPSDCRRILMDASRPFRFEGRTGARVPDALRAVEIARAARTGAQLAASHGSRY